VKVLVVLAVAMVGLGFAGSPAWAQLGAESGVFHESNFSQNPT